MKGARADFQARYNIIELNHCYYCYRNCIRCIMNSLQILVSLHSVNDTAGKLQSVSLLFRYYTYGSRKQDVICQ